MKQLHNPCYAIRVHPLIVCVLSDKNDQIVGVPGSEDICSYGSFESPSNDYSVSWEYNEVTQDISFNITAKQEQDKWTGIGFAPQPIMVRIRFKSCPECSVQYKKINL